MGRLLLFNRQFECEHNNKYLCFSCVLRFGPNFKKANLKKREVEFQFQKLPVETKKDDETVPCGILGTG
jgi:hypothetical protein